MIKLRLGLIIVVVMTTILSIGAAFMPATVVSAADSTTIDCGNGRTVQTFAPNPNKDTICAQSCGSSSVFFIPAWYKGMLHQVTSSNGSTNCEFQPEKGADGKIDITKTALLVGLNILQAALVITGYITIIFLIKGGFEYMLSTGDPGRITSAKGTIRNAIVGMVIAILAASIVNAVGGIIGGS